MFKRFCFLTAMAALALVCSMGTAHAAKVKMSLACAGMTPDSSPGQVIAYMSEKIPEYSGGTIEVATFYNTQLGDSTSMVQGLQQGSVDIGISGNSFFAGLVPQVQVFELPFLFPDYATARKIVDGPIGQKILAMYDKKGIKGLGFSEIGFRHLTNNLHPVKEPADLKGIKIRTLPAPVQVKTWELLGALPTPIEFAELYAAMQQGVVNAQENPLSMTTTMKYYEVQKYMSMTSHVYTPAFLGISMRTWKKLDKQQQEAVLRAAREGIEVGRKHLDANEQVWIKECQDNGMIIEFEPDRAKFRELGQSAYSFFTDKYGDELVKEIQDAQK